MQPRTCKRGGHKRLAIRPAKPAEAPRAKLHTGSGTDTVTDFYWGLHSYVWTNSGDVIKLYNAAGVLVDSYSY